MSASGSLPHLELVLGTAQLRNAYGVTLVRPSAQVGGRGGTPSGRRRRKCRRARHRTCVWRGRSDHRRAAMGRVSPHQDRPWSRPGHLARRVAGSPATGPRADVLYLHDPAEVLRPNSLVIDAAHRLVGNGVGALGASIYEVEEFDAAVADPRIDVIQVPLNVFDRRIDDVRLARARARGVLVYARSVLLQGVLAASPDRVDTVIGGLGRFVAAFQAISRASDRPPVELALGWAQAAAGLSGVVLGAESADELRGLVSAFRSGPLDEAVLSELRSLDQPERPLVDPRQWSVVA